MIFTRIVLTPSPPLQTLNTKIRKTSITVKGIHRTGFGVNFDQTASSGLIWVYMLTKHSTEKLSKLGLKTVNMVNGICA